MKNALNTLAIALVFSSIFFSLTPAATAETAEEHMSDTWLEAKLTTVYALNPHLSIFDIDVEVEDQVTYLSGVVKSSVEKDLATEIARSVTGVKEVKNSIEIVKQVEKKETMTGEFFRTVSDLTTTAAIKSNLLSNPEISGWDIGVKTESKVVTLDGIVPSTKHSALVEQIAKNTNGVDRVQNNLKISDKS